jgi:uncharacterized protein YbbK (DUF523 family)
MNILISACLLGIRCRYDGAAKHDARMEKLMEKHHLIPVCPEIYGGLSTPRDPSERTGDKVVGKNGQNVTAAFQKGAQEALYLAKLFHCEYAILKERSPSCGHGRIYDGTFSGRLTDGSGVTAELLEKNGITVLGESQIDEFLATYS